MLERKFRDNLNSDIIGSPFKQSSPRCVKEIKYINNIDMDRNEVICECFLVSRGEIEDAIRQKKLKTVEDVGYVTNAGTGCGGCRDKIQEILDKVNGK